jgi:hypothetical protein
MTAIVGNISRLYRGAALTVTGESRSNAHMPGKGLSARKLRRIKAKIKVAEVKAK